MRILLISEFFPSNPEADITGGVESSIFYIAKHLALKHEVTVICAHRYSGKRVDFFSRFSVLQAGPPRDPFHDSNLSRLRYVIEAITIAKEKSFDIVMGTNFSNHLIAYFVGKLKKIPVVLWTPDVWKGEWIKNMGIVGGMYGSLIERFNLSHKDTHYIAISDTVKKKMLAFGVPKNCIDVVQCGVDYDLIQKIKPKKKSKITFITVSRLVAYKSVETILYALPKIKEIHPNIRLVIIGKGPEEKKLKKIAMKIKVFTSCDFKGHLPTHKEVLKNIKSSDVFCFASRTEGFGIVILEAMASGVPFVIADTPVHREVTGGNGGIFFTLGNADDLAERVIYLLKNKKAIARLGREGKTWAKKFDWSVQTSKLEKIFKKLLKHNYNENIYSN